ncbi:MAG: hypothetical protein JWM10_1100, partial [Myxococcaceae bacterium]|nr:hypothetical protein [Myxococcaceae bacterium]
MNPPLPCDATPSSARVRSRAAWWLAAALAGCTAPSTYVLDDAAVDAPTAADRGASTDAGPDAPAPDAAADVA